MKMREKVKEKKEEKLKKEKGSETHFQYFSYTRT